MESRTSADFTRWKIQPPKLRVSFKISSNRQSQSTKKKLMITPRGRERGAVIGETKVGGRREIERIK